MLYVEIRAGEGGDDAALFADQLTAALTRWAQTNGLTVEEDGPALLLRGDAHCL